MTRLHELKTWQEPFEAVWSGVKTYEIRVNDRGFRDGDMLCLREWDRHAEKYTGRVVCARVGYMSDSAWGLPRGLCVLSLLDVAQQMEWP